MPFALLALFFALILQSLDSPSQAAAVWLAGLAASALSQLLKRFFGKDEFVAFLFTCAVSVAIALAAGWYTGEIHTLSDVSRLAPAVLGTATVVFRVFKHGKEAAASLPIDPKNPPEQ